MSLIFLMADNFIFREKTSKLLKMFVVFLVT